jgi:drug/metabolite transporter (DMT)-like permease
MRDKFSLVRWLALAILFAGLLIVFFTENPRWWILFNGMALLMICFDSFVLTASPKLSLLHPADDPKPKFRPSPLLWIAFALLLIGGICGIYGAHLRLSALLNMSGLCLAAFIQYRRANPNRIVRN